MFSIAVLYNSYFTEKKNHHAPRNLETLRGNWKLNTDITEANVI